MEGLGEGGAVAKFSAPLGYRIRLLGSRVWWLVVIMMGRWKLLVLGYCREVCIPGGM